MITIETETIRRLAMLLCTQKEAAAFLGITLSKFRSLLRSHPSVKHAWYSGLESGKISIRRKQMRLANSSSAMAIFLGKNYLGQRDKSISEITGVDGDPVKFASKIEVEFISTK